jgi:hypothetical protein
MPDDLEPDPPGDRCTLSTRLLHALLAGTTPDHPVVGIAVDRVLRTESLASYTAETALATELLVACTRPGMHRWRCCTPRSPPTTTASSA